MNEEDFSVWLWNLLEDSDEVKRVLSYEGAGLLTLNDGLFVAMIDGSEYQITIVKSK